MIKSPPIHPLLISIFPVFSLFAHNIAQAEYSVMMTPLIVIIFCSLSLVILINAFLQNLYKSALIVSLFSLCFFSYHHIFSSFYTLFHTVTGTFIAERALHLLLMTSLFFIFTLILLGIKKTSFSFEKITMLFNFAGTVLIILPFFNIIHFELNKESFQSYTDTNNHKISNTLVPFQKGESPDIYYLIFDRYESAENLMRFQGFDNSAFIDDLRKKGFFVADKSFANYQCTAQSLSSSLNMRYHDSLTGITTKGVTDWKPIYAMLKDHVVGRFLKNHGYTFIQAGSSSDPTSFNEFANVNIIRFHNSEFSLFLIRNTMFYPIYCNLPKSLKFGNFDESLNKFKSVTYSIDKISEVPYIETPTFVFAHFLVPHPPYIFDENGDFLSVPHSKTKNEHYIDQVNSINPLIIDLVDKLIKRSDTAPVILIQSDEGTYADGFQGDYAKATNADLVRKFGILNAYYLPDFDMENFYHTMSPVNSFRIVFNHYFGTKYKLLADKSFVYENENNIFTFIDISDRLK